MIVEKIKNTEETKIFNVIFYFYLAYYEMNM